MDRNHAWNIGKFSLSLRLIASFTQIIAAAWYAEPVFAENHSDPINHSVSLKNIVLLYGERIELPRLNLINDKLNQSLREAFPNSLEIYREELDLTRFSGEYRMQLLQRYLSEKYLGKKIDVVVAVTGPALDFMLGYGNSIFPDASLVFCAIDKLELNSYQLPANVTGVVTERQFSPTFELARLLHPDLKHAVIISGSSQSDTQLLTQAKDELRKFDSEIDIKYMTTSPMAVMLEKLAQLPEDSVIFYTLGIQPGANKVYSAHQMIERITTTANAPVYGFVDQHLGHGIVGGHITSLEAQVNETTGLVKKILNGVKPENLPMIIKTSSQTFVDWRQLQHWHIAESRLPQDTVVKYREPTIWSQYGTFAVSEVILTFILTLLAGGLLVKHIRLQRVKAKLGQNESRFRHLIESQLDLICQYLPDTTLTFANEAFCRFLKMSQQELIGKKLIDLLAEPTRNMAMHQINNVIDQCQRCSYDYRMELTNGNSGWHHWEVYPITDTKGRITEIQAIGHDIADRKRAEEANINLTHAMRLAVAGELTAMVAHEVSQPLGAIMANADAAQIMLRSSNPPIEELRQILADIRASDQRADQAIRRIRNLLRKRELHMQPLDLNDTVATTLQLVSGDALHRNVIINSKLMPELPPILGDNIYLQQVLLNLIINGMDAMHETPRTARYLTVQTKSLNEHQIGVFVSDNGKGIAPEHIKDVFGSFYTTKKNGMGLGLTICQSIIESHQGKIWVENKLSGGATFQFTLKVA